MGLYDTIEVWMTCPYCKKSGLIECQTKDLGCIMYNYYALSSDWFTHKFERKMRLKLPVFPAFPLDKSHKLWKNQAERREARATVPKEFKHLKFVTVIASCHSDECKAWAKRRDKIENGYVSGFSRAFDGKIKIKNGKLFGEVYDIEKTNSRIKYPKKKVRKHV